MQNLENVEVTATQTFTVDGKEKKEKKVVAKLNIRQADNWDEAVQIAGSSEEALRLFNVQYKTTEMNRARQAAVGAPPAKQLQAEAIQRIFTTPELQARLTAAGGDVNATQTLIAEVIETLKKEYEAKRASIPAAVVNGGEDEDQE